MLKTKLICVLLLLTVLPRAFLTIKIHCKHAERIREDHIHYCCKHPDGHNDITEACAKQTGFKLPAPNEEAPEDVTVEQVVKGTCWSQCVFQKYNFIKDNDLDMDAVRRHYKEVHALDPEYEREMIAAFELCHGQSEAAAMQFMAMMSTFDRRHTLCDARGTVILSCVIHNFFHNCPKDRWAGTKECMETAEFARKCKDALTTM